MLKTPTKKLTSAITVCAAVLLGAVRADSAAAQLAGAGGGIANRAGGRLANLNANGPGFLYYGVNGADRGLGYIGSYMTLGGFVPLAEDDLGGVWNADLRSHLSVNGGFFSNVGAVRKQLLGGGSVLGFGIFWDYDGDLNQYSTFGEPAAIFGQFGHTYNQVGVSGELLTDWGNLRSNGYIPVGQSGFQLLNDHTPFIQHYIVAQNGLDAALGGADLELGAYIPALADWAGMINVGGYAFGNGRYTQNYGPDAGADLVPWFGGVYTRLDLTLGSNWDFSLQYNNDSFFDSTGFARLTYRMGGSRRRNVPDQMEQPMFRNEHIVRAHETPLVALNPQNGNQPWQVVHVDSSAFPGGDGTAEAPVRSLAEAQDNTLVPLADDPWTITYLWAGLSSASGNVAINPYTDSFAFQAQNQFLIGSGGPLTIGTQPASGSRLLTIPQLTSTRPVLTNNDLTDNNGASVVIADGNGGATVANLRTLGSLIGLDASGDLSSGTAQPVGTTANPFGSPFAAAGGSAARNISIQGDGTSGIQRGVRIANVAGTSPTAPDGDIEFSDALIQNTTSVAFQVGAFDNTVSPPAPISNSGGSANIDFHGTITNNTAENGNFSSVLIAVLGTTDNAGDAGTINLASTATPIGAIVPNQILDVGGQGIFIAENNSAGSPRTNINIGNTTLANTTPTAIAIENDFANTSITAVATPDYAYGITKTSGNATIGINGGGPIFSFNGTINNGLSPLPNGPIIGIRQVADADIQIAGPGLSPLLSNAGGVEILEVTNSDISITGADLRGNIPASFLVRDTSGATTITATDTRIIGATQQGVLLDDLKGTTLATFDGLDVALNNTGSVGVEYRNSSNNGDVTFSNTIITGATSQGVLLTDTAGGGGTTIFEGLEINLTSGTARGFEAVNAGDVYTTGTTNTIVNASTTLAAIYIDGTTTLAGPGGAGLDFLAVRSGNTQGTGQITGLTLITPGADYPISTTLGVDVESPTTTGGATATAFADTDPAGLVTTLTVDNAGSGYAVGDPVTLPPTDPTTIVTTEATGIVASTVDPTETAITINETIGGATGEINMQTFTVGGAVGSGVNVKNPGGTVDIKVGGTTISP